MSKHFVYFYGPTKIISGSNSLSEEMINKRNQIIGFDGIDTNPELIEFGEKCLNAISPKGGVGETGTLFPKNITIVPFKYFYNEKFIIHHLEDVILANENYIKAESIGFPLLNLKHATNEGYNLLGLDANFERSNNEKEFKSKWCCFGHYYLSLIKKALNNKGYYAVNKSSSNLINERFIKDDGKELIIHADAGM